jgi:hypothetical protein
VIALNISMDNLFSLCSTSDHTTSRRDFEESWLQEQPMGIHSHDFYPYLTQAIQDRLEMGQTPEHIGDDLFRIVGAQLVYYWYQVGDHILLGTELTKKPQTLVVNFAAKSPQHQNQPPWASDLYMRILQDCATPLRLMSDHSLTHEGLKIWKTLLAQGVTIMVYDTQNPGVTNKMVTSTQELLKHFGDGDADFKRYQYVLTLGNHMLAETRGLFNTRRMRELAGIL